MAILVEANACLVKAKDHCLVWWYNQDHSKFLILLLVGCKIIFQVFSGEDTHVCNQFNFLKAIIVVMKYIFHIQVWLLGRNIKGAVNVISFENEVAVDGN